MASTHESYSAESRISECQNFEIPESDEVDGALSGARVPKATLPTKSEGMNCRFSKRDSGEFCLGCRTAEFQESHGEQISSEDTVL